MAITLVTGLTDAQLADYELRAEAAMLAALQAVADQMADQIAQIQVATAGPARLLADVREVWAGCPYGFHPAHVGPCPVSAAGAVLVAADPPPVPDIPGPPGQPYVSPDDLAQMTRLWDDQVQQQLIPVVAEVYSTSAGTVHSQMVGASGVAALPSVSSQAAEEYLAAARNTFDMVGDSLWQNARNSLLDGFKAGDSIPELAARVRGSAQMTAPTATLVARTQVLDASNSGSIATARASGLNLRKGWFATPDLRTRPSHMTAGHTYGTERGYIPLDQPFYVGGEACDRPHDPVLSPANRYSCRCTTGYAVSNAAPQQRAQRQVPPLPGQSGAPVIPPLAPPTPMVPPAQLPGGQIVAELRAAQTARIEELAATQQAELAAMVADQHAAVDAVLATQRARFAAQTAEHQRQVRHFEAQAAKRHARVDEIAEEHRAGMAQITQQARDRAAALDELSVQQSVEIDNILAGQQAAVRRILADEEARVRRISADISAALRRRGVRPVPGGAPQVPPVGPAPLQRALPEIDLGEPIRGVRTALHVARTNDELVVAMRAEVARITGRQVVVELPPDASLASAREMFEGVLQGMEAYPQSTIRRISWFARRNGHYAETSADEILFNRHWIARGRRKQFVKKVQQDVQDWDFGLPAWMPRGAGNPQALGVHEYSHAVHLSLPDARLLSERVVEIVRRRAAVEGITPDALVRREIGAYATSDDLELIAGAATDVAMNGRSASLLSREIMAAYDDAYRAAGRAPGVVRRGVTGLAEPRGQYVYSSTAPTLQDLIANPSYAAQIKVRLALQGEYPGGLKVEVQTVAFGDDGMVVSGVIRNSTGRKVGEFRRRVETEDGKLVAFHDVLSLDRKMDQGSGFAEAFNGNLMDWYERSGVTEVRLTANIDVGGYAWASRGYEFRTAAEAADWLDDAEDKVFQALAALRQTGKLPKGLSEDGLRSLQTLVEDMRAGRVATSAPEIAKFGRLPGQGGKAAVWPGKWLMLGTSWHGRLPVSPVRAALRIRAKSVPGPAPFSRMTVGELKAMARERGIPGYSAMRKQELVDALSGPTPAKAAKAAAKKAAPAQAAQGADLISQDGLDRYIAWLTRRREELGAAGRADNFIQGRAFSIRAVAGRQGFDRTPVVVTAEDLDRLIADGATPMYRGLIGGPDASGTQRTSAFFADEFRRGEAHWAAGTNGSGIYFIAGREAAETYADSAAGVLRAVLRPDAKVITRQEVRGLIAEAKARARAAGVEFPAFLEDEGVFAASLGYDAMTARARSGLTTIVLNRSAVIVEGRPVAQAAVRKVAAKKTAAKAVAKKAPAKKAPAPKAPPTKTVQADELQPGDRIYVRERRSDGEIVPAGSGGRLVTVVSSERDRDFLNAQVIRAIDENGNDVLIVSTANPTRGGTGYLNTFDRIRVAPPTATPTKAAKKAPAPKPPKPLPAPERMTPAALRKELEAAGVDLPAKVAKPDLQRWVTDLRAAPAAERQAAVARITDLATPTATPSRRAGTFADIDEAVRTMPRQADFADRDEFIRAYDAWRDRNLSPIVNGEFAGIRVRPSEDFGYVVVRRNDGSLSEIILSGELTKNGREVGLMLRRIYRDKRTGELVADHQYLEISRGLQGSGFAEQFNENLFEWYRRSGVRRVELTANVDVGGYAWAARGFEFADSAAAREFLDEAGRKIAKALAGRAPKGITKDELRELGAFIEDMRLGRRTARPIDIARFGRRPGQGGKTAVWPGKWLLLGSSWRGRLLL